jgi:hypothetical protein
MGTRSTIPTTAGSVCVSLPEGEQRRCYANWLKLRRVRFIITLWCVARHRHL